MIFSPPLLEAILLKRYKRFLADVRLPNGDEFTVHCPNPGSMAGLSEPGIRCWISDSGNPKRKLRHTLELVEANAIDGPTMVGVNTNHPNKLAKEAILDGKIAPLNGYETLRTEVKYGENSRIDILLESPDRPACYVEVKNVHFVRTRNLHEFPDSKTARGAKHLRELANMIQQGHRAVMLYVIQRMDGDSFQLADDIDHNYAREFDAACASGVEAYAIRCQISPTEIIPDKLISVDRAIQRQ